MKKYLYPIMQLLFWFLTFFLVFELDYHFTTFNLSWLITSLALVEGTDMNASDILKLKGESYNFGRGWFVHVAQQMQNSNSDTFLTPLRFSRPFSTHTSLVEITDRLWDSTSFFTAFFVLMGVLTLSIFISSNFPESGETARQLVKEYTLLEQSGYLTNAEKWDFLLAYFESGTWVFLVLDAAEKISYFIMLRAALQTSTLYYAEQYGNVILLLMDIAPLPFPPFHLIR